MVKKIIIISPHFYPDIGPASIRSTLIAEELSLQNNVEVVVLTQFPNRYKNINLYKDDFEKFDKLRNFKIIRFKNYLNHNFFISRYLNFIFFSFRVILFKEKNIYATFSTSAKFFSNLLGFLFGKKNKSKIFLDIRDLFILNISEIYLKSLVFKPLILMLKLIEIKIYKKSNINIISPGFKNYFKILKINHTNYFHGIPDIFLKYYQSNGFKKEWVNHNNIVTYIGNIGEGQNIHNLFLNLAVINKNFKFRIIGGGKFFDYLKKKIYEEEINNIELIPPMRQSDLINYYTETDFLVTNLNSYESFKLVIPSKIFEYSVFSKPLLLGIDGHAKLLASNIEASYFFKPNNYIELNSLLNKLKNLTILIDRDNFISNNSYRLNMNKYAKSIVS